MMISKNYKGPIHLKEDVELALSILAKKITYTRTTAKTLHFHEFDNLENPDVLEAIAIYLCAAISQNISANLEIRQALFDEDSVERDLLNDIVRLIGVDNDESTKKLKNFKDTQRDAWIWEGVSHLLIHVNKVNADSSIGGVIVSTNGIKLDVHDHGLDLIALYKINNSIGVLAGECKAYRKRPADAIRDASKKLLEVDESTRDGEIRANMTYLKDTLSEDEKASLSGVFWRNERSYLPAICCTSDKKVKWGKNRKALTKLNVIPSKKTLLPLTLTDIRKQFDVISDLMRLYPNHK